MITKLPIKVIDGKISRVEELELRIMNLEAVLNELKGELSSMKFDVKEEDIKRIEKLNKYQRTIDNMWLSQTSAV
ncbi:MAG: hypothetical protein U0354_20540 [Candidatus Sericytochromatia bacterium]